jgi:hypothetical protein
LDFKGWLSALDGGSFELGAPDLTRKIVDGIARLRHHAGRGVAVLPPEVEVHVQVADGSVHVIEKFVQDPLFDREVEAALRNKLVDVPEHSLPIRRYIVEPGKRTRVVVVESRPKRYSLRIEGGDRDGTVIAIPGDQRDVLLGRGPWHGDDEQVANDIQVAEADRRISRRAARMHRTGGLFELEALDQAEAIAVVKPDGHRQRPALSATGKVQVRPGDVIEFLEGARPVLTVRLEEE